MASQSPYNAGTAPGQAQVTCGGVHCTRRGAFVQMRREHDNMQNQPSDIHNEGQTTNFLQETGTQVKNMTHGATEVGKGAVLGVASVARGAAQGAANVAQGAADAFKNTFGMNNPSTDGSTHPNMVNLDMDGSTYPSKPSYAHTPNTNNI